MEGCRSVKSNAFPFSRVMLHPPPSFLLPSSCGSDRLCVGVHERNKEKEREWWREKALIYVKADMRGGARLKHGAWPRFLLTLHSESSTNQNQLCSCHDTEHDTHSSHLTSLHITTMSMLMSNFLYYLQLYSPFPDFTNVKQRKMDIQTQTVAHNSAHAVTRKINWCQTESDK